MIGQTLYLSAALLLGLGLAAPSGSVQAVTLGIQPGQQSVNPGGTVDVEVFVTGLGNGIAPSLAAYDLNISFDPAVFGYTGTTFGGGSGDQLDFSGFADKIATVGRNFVNLYEVSLDTIVELNTLQADSFILATLSFSALSVGASPLTISVNAFGDADGNDIPIDLIQNGSAAVPEPASLGLVLIGLFQLFACHFGRGSSS